MYIKWDKLFAYYLFWETFTQHNIIAKYPHQNISLKPIFLFLFYLFLLYFIYASVLARARVRGAYTLTLKSVFLYV